MAPQILGEQGYSWQVDWWSLGVTAYELLFHKHPFDGSTKETMIQSILKDTLTFLENTLATSHNCSRAAISALRGVSFSCRGTLYFLLTWWIVHRLRPPICDWVAARVAKDLRPSADIHGLLVSMQRGYYKLYSSLHLGFGGRLCFSLFQLFVGYLLVQSTLVMKSETASALIRGCLA